MLLPNLQVLKGVREDTRMPITKISRRTGLTSRRIRRIFQEFHGEAGTPIETVVAEKSKTDLGHSVAAVHFRIGWNLNAGGGLVFVFRVNWDEGKGIPDEIVSYFAKQLPFEFWFAFRSATEPILYSVFIVNHIHDSVKILPILNKAPHTIRKETWVSFPLRKYIGLRESIIDKMIADAGL